MAVHSIGSDSWVGIFPGANYDVTVQSGRFGGILTFDAKYNGSIYRIFCDITQALGLVI